MPDETLKEKLQALAANVEGLICWNCKCTHIKKLPSDEYWCEDCQKTSYNREDFTPCDHGNATNSNITNCPICKPQPTTQAN